MAQSRRELVSEHLNAFTSFVKEKPDPDDPGGKLGRSFADGLQEVDAQAILPKKLTRKKVFELSANSQLSTPTVCAAALAWGGMRINHRDMAFDPQRVSEWYKVADQLRQGSINRAEAYEAFSELRRARKLKGMGPAYFTKLIYFLMPKNDAKHPRGFIMDQWAGCSVNLLCGQGIVRLNSNTRWIKKSDRIRTETSFVVSDFNTAKQYEDFCLVIEQLADLLGEPVDQIDRTFVDGGGKARKGWRQYLLEHTRP